MRRAKALPHRHVPLPGPTPPAPGPSNPSTPYAPTPTTPPGAPVPKIERHPARPPWGYHMPAPAQAEPASQQLHDPPAGPAVRPAETPSGSHPAPTGTRTRTPRTPPSWLTPRRQTRQAASYRRGSRIPRVGHRQPGLPRRSKLAARGHWEATWEASPGRQACQMAKSERRRNW